MTNGKLFQQLYSPGVPADDEDIAVGGPAFRGEEREVILYTQIQRGRTRMPKVPDTDAFTPMKTYSHGMASAIVTALVPTSVLE